MLRRSVLSLLGGFVASLGAGWVTAASARPGVPPLDLATLPFPIVKVRGVDALETWEQLRAKGEGWPVILGDALGAAWLSDAFEIDSRSVDEVLAAAAELTFPASLAAMNSEDADGRLAALRGFPPDAVAYRMAETTVAGHVAIQVLPAESEEGRPVTYRELREQEEASDPGPTVGEWPDSPEVGSGPTGFVDFETGQFAETVYIGILPTKDPTSVPAHLRFGGWNACPPPEHHVAVLRSLRERYGAEIIVCTSDTVELRVQRRPATREEAIALARDLYLYCNDNIDQGLGTVSEFAAYLMASDWWFFWWD